MFAERKNYGEFRFFTQLRQKLPNKNKTGCHCYKYWKGRSDVIVTNTNTSLLKHFKTKFHKPSNEVDLFLADKQT